MSNSFTQTQADRGGRPKPCPGPTHGVLRLALQQQGLQRAALPQQDGEPFGFVQVPSSVLPEQRERLQSKTSGKGWSVGDDSKLKCVWFSQDICWHLKQCGFTGLPPPPTRKLSIPKTSEQKHSKGSANSLKVQVDFHLAFDNESCCS